jgi:Holliday junction resolvase
MNHPSPDIIAGKNGILYAIECKTTKEEKQYFNKKEINELKEFTKIITASAYAAVKFPKEEWRFYPLINLKETDKNYVINKKDNYLKVEDIFEKFKNS